MLLLRLNRTSGDLEEVREFTANRPATTGTVDPWSLNVVDADNQDLTFPDTADLEDLDEVQFFYPDTRAGCHLIPNSGQTMSVPISGRVSGSQSVDDTPGFYWYVWDEAGSNWFPKTPVST